MSQIHYFPYDHLDVTVGINKNRVLKTGQDELALYELRMTTPYKEHPIDADALHSIEHLGLDYLYKNELQREKVFFFGTMSCRTGCIIIVQNMTEAELVNMIEEMFAYIAEYDGELPLLRRSECGNIYGHNPLLAKEHVTRYAKYLKTNPQGDCSYPK